MLELTSTHRKVVTCFSEHPLGVKRVDEDDGGLGEGHEEVTHGQIHNEVVRQTPQLLIARKDKQV